MLTVAANFFVADFRESAVCGKVSEFTENRLD